MRAYWLTRRARVEAEASVVGQANQMDVVRAGLVSHADRYFAATGRQTVILISLQDSPRRRAISLPDISCSGHAPALAITGSSACCCRSSAAGRSCCSCRSWNRAASRRARGGRRGAQKPRIAAIASRLAWRIQVACQAGRRRDTICPTCRRQALSMSRLARRSRTGERAYA